MIELEMEDLGFDLDKIIDIGEKADSSNINSLYNGKPVEPVKKKKQHHTQVGDCIVKSVIYKKLHKCMGLYLYLRANAVRNDWIGHDTGVYDKYYTKLNLIVAKKPYSKIRYDLGMDNETVKTYVDIMASVDVLEVKKMPTKGKNKKMSYPNIYVLGTHVNGKESFYIDNL